MANKEDQPHSSHQKHGPVTCEDIIMNFDDLDTFFENCDPDILEQQLTPEEFSNYQKWLRYDSPGATMAKRQRRAELVQKCRQNKSDDELMSYKHKNANNMRQYRIQQKHNLQDNPAALEEQKRKERERKQRVRQQRVTQKETQRPKARQSLETFDETTVDYKDIGDMNNICSACGALMFKQETHCGKLVENEPSATFSLCCSNGAIKLPQIKDPPDMLQELLTGHTQFPSKHTCI